MIKKIWERILLGIITVFILLLTAISITLVLYQDKAIQKIVHAFNDDFHGVIVVGDTDISLLENFPNVTIIVRNVQIYEDKVDMFAPILDVSYFHIGFNLWTLINKDFKINQLHIENGNLDIIRYKDGSFNIKNALSSDKKIEDIKNDFNIEIQKIELSNIDIIKYDETTNIHVETYIENIESKFIIARDTILISLESHLFLTIINNGDSTIFKKKHFDANTELIYDKEKDILTINPSEIFLENADFSIDGSINIMDDFDINLNIHGNKPNFNLFIAFAPEELIPTLEQYENAGNIFFEATIQGKSMSGFQPAINAQFGCDSAYFNNPVSNKKLEEISFTGYFTNGESRNTTTMEFVLENMTAKPEAGTFLADLKVNNFESPDIDMHVTSNFDLDFLAKFLNVTTLQNLDGDVSIKMNFRDIIDLEHPEKSLEKFSQSYFTELNVNDLTFKIPGYPWPFDSIDIKATMEGNRAKIDHMFLKVGNSDITLKGEIDNLPAIIHQTSDEVNSELSIYSSLLDLKQLTSYDTINKKPFNEQINNLKLDLAFITEASSFMESPNLPEGKFFIKNFYADLKNYPHTLKKFNAQVIVGEEGLEIINFSGKIDESDFQYSGKLDNYTIWLQDTAQGNMEFEFDLTSKRLNLTDLFAYGGENYVPEDYRHEGINDLRMHGYSYLRFNKTLQSTEIYFDRLDANLKHHQMELEQFQGKIRYTGDQLILDTLSGKVGNSTFIANMVYHFEDNDRLAGKNNYLHLKASSLDFDQLFSYDDHSSMEGTNQAETYDSAFNIYQLPFPDMTLDIAIDKLNYHKHQITTLKADIRIQKNHFIFVDTLKLQTAGGKFDISGYFNGSNLDSIYFYPKINISNINLDQMLYRFDNFGQEQLVSENLKGVISGTIKGKVQMHTDMVPKIDESELQMELEIVDGELKNYKPLNALSEYFKDKNLSIIRFDTLSNKLNLANGIITIPKMTINSTLGYLDISGTQDMGNDHMEYYIKIPMKMIAKSARNKLFGKKETISDSTQIDVIQYKDTSKKTWYLNLKLIGNPDDFKVSIGKKK